MQLVSTFASPEHHAVPVHHSVHLWLLTMAKKTEEEMRSVMTKWYD